MTSALLWTVKRVALSPIGPNQQGKVSASNAWERAASMSDPSEPMFSHEPDQLSLFGAAEEGMQPPVRQFVADTELVRRRLHALLAKARAAAVMPWPERDARMWQAVFPQMADWLPDDEAGQLRFEFMQEIERLKAA